MLRSPRPAPLPQLFWSEIFRSSLKLGGRGAATMIGRPFVHPEVVESRNYFNIPLLLAKISQICTVACQQQGQKSQFQNDCCGHNILRICQIFLSPQVKWGMIISIYELHHKLPNNLRLMMLSLKSFSQIKIKNFIDTSKNLQKNRNWAFLVVHYFTWKLEFVSNILSMIVAIFSWCLF